MIQLKHGSIFSGIGGFDLAAQHSGWENLFHCENNLYCLHVLKYYWPNAETHTDIKKTCFKKYKGHLDVLSGGFPCQPYSAAGKRKGRDDDRHLWPEMLRAIRESSPRWVVGENVFGLTNWDGGLVFEQVCADMENEGYEVTPYILPACSVNAPHRRDRVFFIAYKNPDTDGRDSGNREDKSGVRKFRNISTGVNEQLQPNNKKTNKRSNVANCNKNGQHRGNGKDESESDQTRQYALSNTQPVRKHASNSKSIGQKQSINTRRGRAGFENNNSPSKYDPNSENIGLQGRGNAGVLQEEGTDFYKRFKHLVSFSGRQWEDFPTQSPLCSGDDGFSGELVGITIPKTRGKGQRHLTPKQSRIRLRREAISGFGNAVVPALVEQIFSVINQYENLYGKFSKTS